MKKPSSKSPQEIREQYLKKTELIKQARYVKIIKAVQNSYEQYDTSPTQEQLFEKVNRYLERDGYKTISLSTLKRTIKELENLRFKEFDQPIHVLSYPQGEKKGSLYWIALDENALHCVNGYFLSLAFERKVNSLQDKKMNSLKREKVNSLLKTIKKKSIKEKTDREPALPVPHGAQKEPQSPPKKVSLSFLDNFQLRAQEELSKYESKKVEELLQDVRGKYTFKPWFLDSSRYSDANNILERFKKLNKQVTKLYPCSGDCGYGVLIEGELCTECRHYQKMGIVV